MGITVHWMSKKFKLKDLGLYFHVMSGPHTGANISEAFIEILNKFDATEKVWFSYVKKSCQ